MGLRDTVKKIHDLGNQEISFGRKPVLQNKQPQVQKVQTQKPQSVTVNKNFHRHSFISHLRKSNPEKPIHHPHNITARIVNVHAGDIIVIEGKGASEPQKAPEPKPQRPRNILFDSV